MTKIMNTYQKILKRLNVNFAKTFKNDVDKTSTYYAFAANPIPQNKVAYPSDSTKTDIDTYSSMLFGNKIQDTDVSLVTNHYAWKAGETYNMYDPADAELYSKPFYVTVSEGSNYNVYKCLDNNRGSASIDQPLGTDSTLIYSMTDGYVWKYLYTISDFMYRKFGSDTNIPVDIDQNGQSVTNLGGIEIIGIKEPGFGYNNYTIGSFAENSSINYRNSATQHLLDSNASTKNSFYTGCLMKVTSASNSQSEYRTITDYNISGSRRIVVIDSPFTLDLKGGDLYEIYPQVVIQDLNDTATACIARAIISPNSGNSVSQIEVINPGSTYRNVSAYVAAHASVGVSSNCSINPIISPVYGHGSDLAEELFANKVCITTAFNDSSGVILNDNGYGTIGIIKDPAFANVAVTLNPETIVGSFIQDEKVYRYRSYKLNGNISIQSNSTIITSDDSDFSSSLRNNDRVIITNGFQNLFANVSTIIDTNTVMLDQLPPFTDTNCKISIAETVPFGEVTSYNLNTILNLTNVIPNNFDAFTADLVGADSNCTASINSSSSSYITVNGRPAFNFAQFTQLTKFVGTIDSNKFLPNEKLIQGNIQSAATPSAILFSANNTPGINNDTLYVTDPNNTFQPGTITGSTSGGLFTYQYKYDGELVRDSGDILYLENLNYINRSSTQTETIKIILEF